MDFLLIFYYFLFVTIIVSPFAFLALRYKDKSISPFGQSPREDLVNLREEKSILLSNLADLKAEQETGKLKEGEFRNLSQDILFELSRLDKEIDSIDKSSVNAGDYKKESISSEEDSYSTDSLEVKTESTNIEEVSKSKASFCPQCGTKRLQDANFCHSCGFSYK